MNDRMNVDQTYQPGQIVYVIVRNPHVQNVANVQEAAIVRNPDHPEELALFLYETYYPLSDELAIYESEREAEQAYEEAFGPSEAEDLYG